MSLPIRLLPIVERWDCHQCGVCCRGSIVPLSDEDTVRLKSQGWQERAEFKGIRTTVPLDRGRSQQQLGKRDDGSCVFLQPDGLCLIHKELGFAAKPLVCRMFPLQLVPHEKEAVLTLRRACPSAAGDRGREMTEHLAEVRAYAREGNLIEEATAAPPFKLGEPGEWKRSRLVMESLRRLTGDERYPIVRRLIHGLELCRLLEQASTKELGNKQLAELISVLEENVAEEASPHFLDRRPPSSASRVLFRQTALELVRLHPRSYCRPSWSSRLQLAWWAIKMVVGRGKLPRIHPQFPKTNFATLEEPLGKLDLKLHEPLWRYFETTTGSYQYALGQKTGWSVIESYRELALLYPLGRWILRWATGDREPTTEDVFDLIAALDRAQGYAPLAGMKQRARVRTLAQLGELSTLVAWYGR